MFGALLRAKIIAIYLGAVGIGLYSVLISVVMFVQQACSIGIFQASVKELSIAYSNEDISTFNRLYHSINRITDILALAGCIILIVLSYSLSQYFFNDNYHSLFFAATSFAIIFFCKSQFYSIILQSTQQLLKLSKASIFASIISALLSIVLIWKFKYWGIVITIITSYFTIFLFTKIYQPKISISSNYTIPQSFANSKIILGRGFFLMLGAFSITFFTFLLNAVVSKEGIATIGYYQASISIMSQGLVIISMILSTEFYPRLSAIANYIEKQKAVNNEFKLLLWIIIPITSLILLFSPIIIDLLYTSDFKIVVTMVRIMAVSLLFRAIWMTFSFIILAAGEKYNYFIYDGLIGNGLNFCLSILGFKIYGLIGLSYAWILSSFIVCLILGIVCYKKYNITLNFSIICQTIIFFLLSITICLMLIYRSGYGALVISAFFSVVCIMISATKLNLTSKISQILKK